MQCLRCFYYSMKCAHFKRMKRYLLLLLSIILTKYDWQVPGDSIQAYACLLVCGKLAYHLSLGMNFETFK